MAITAKEVQELRARTGAGMMDCKKALEETGGDMEKAVEYLRARGAAKAEKRAGREAREGVISSYLQGGSVAALCDGPLATAMHAVGELWKHGPEGIFIEHRALDVCVQALNHLRGLLPPAEEDAPVALGGAVENDPYELPTLMAATVLAAAGWRVVNLGPNLPMEALLLAVKRHQPRLVWLSCSVLDAAVASRSEVRKAAAVVTGQGRKMIAGGRGWKGMRLEPEDGLMMVGSMAEVAAFAEGLQAAMA